jgi:histidinol-phosphate aminotransferase
MIRDLARQNVLNLTPYSSARDDYTGKGEVWLDANENPFQSGLNRYPDPYQRDLKEAIAQIHNLDVDRIILGNGSDELIDLLIRTFCEPRSHQVILFPPTYGMYRVCAGINDVGIEAVPQLEGFRIDLAGLEQKMSDTTRMIFIGSPNNPTGHCLDREVVQDILERFNGIVVVDEAYIDFSPEKTMLPLLNDHSNLVILRTFSKAWGLAGIRLGIGFGSPDLIHLLNRIKPPYNVSTLTQKEALKALQNPDKKSREVRTILEQKSWVEDRLRNLSIVEHVFPSDANFLLVRFQTAIPGLYQYLIDHQVVVRDRSGEWLCHGCLRITIGTARENQHLLSVLKNFSDEKGIVH